MCQRRHCEGPRRTGAVEQRIELLLICKLFAQDVQNIIRKRWLSHVEPMMNLYVGSVDDTSLDLVVNGPPLARFGRDLHFPGLSPRNLPSQCNPLWKQKMVLLNFSLTPEAASKIHDLLVCLGKFSDTIAIEARRDRVGLGPPPSDVYCLIHIFTVHLHSLELFQVCIRRCHS